MLGDLTVKKKQNLEGEFVFNWKSIKQKRHVLCGRKPLVSMVRHTCAKKDLQMRT